MAKSTKTKSKAPSRLPTLQIPCSEELKQEVEELARAFNRKDVKSLLLPLVEQFVERNRSHLEKYRALANTEIVTPFDEAKEKPTAKRIRKPKKNVDETAAQVAAVDEGGGSNENT